MIATVKLDTQHVHTPALKAATRAQFVANKPTVMITYRTPDGEVVKHKSGADFALTATLEGGDTWKLTFRPTITTNRHQAVCTLAILADATNVVEVPVEIRSKPSGWLAVENVPEEWNMATLEAFLGRFLRRDQYKAVRTAIHTPGTAFVQLRTRAQATGAMDAYLRQLPQQLKDSDEDLAGIHVAWCLNVNRPFTFEQPFAPGTGWKAPPINRTEAVIQGEEPVATVTLAGCPAAGPPALYRDYLAMVGAPGGAAKKKTAAAAAATKKKRGTKRATMDDAEDAAAAAAQKEVVVFNDERAWKRGRKVGTYDAADFTAVEALFDPAGDDAFSDDTYDYSLTTAAAAGGAGAGAGAGPGGVTLPVLVTTPAGGGDAYAAATAGAAAEEEDAVVPVFPVGLFDLGGAFAVATPAAAGLTRGCSPRAGSPADDFDSFDDDTVSEVGSTPTDYDSDAAASAQAAATAAAAAAVTMPELAYDDFDAFGEALGDNPAAVAAEIAAGLFGGARNGATDDDDDEDMFF